MFKIASGLKQGEKKQWYLYSTCHLMALSIKQYGDIRVVNAPNDTLRHKKIVVKSLGKIKRLTPEAFWDYQNQDLHFPENKKNKRHLNLPIYLYR